MGIGRLDLIIGYLVAHFLEERAGLGAELGGAGGEGGGWNGIGRVCGRNERVAPPAAAALGALRLLAACGGTRRLPICGRKALGRVFFLFFYLIVERRIGIVLPGL